MAELSKRIQAAHGHHGGTSSHHQNQQQQQQQIVERYKELSATSDDIPKPLSVDYFLYFINLLTKKNIFTINFDAINHI